MDVAASGDAKPFSEASAAAASSARSVRVRFLPDFDTDGCGGCTTPGHVAFADDPGLTADLLPFDGLVRCVGALCPGSS